MTIQRITLYRVKMLLSVAYHVSYRVYEDFEPIIVEARDTDGRIGWGEGHISPGHTFETIDGGWEFCRNCADKAIGMAPAEAKAAVAARVPESPVAASALVTAFEMLEAHPVLTLDKDVSLPLLTPFHSTDHSDIPGEVNARVAEGFRTLKVKVGKNWEEDVAKVRSVQHAAKGRAVIRLDANRGFNREDGCRFGASLDPEGIELFEQPCESDAWDDNAAVASVSTVPVMLDESIYDLGDIRRAGGVDGIRFVKLKLKKMGGLDLLADGLNLIRDLGMIPVLGDGVSTELCCWMEACVARQTIDNAGEFNGFLKPRDRLFSNPLHFADGALHMKAGYMPEIDRAALAAHTIDEARFARTAVATS
ncbi:mandelate racemase [Alphaproteobacteria bacterium]|nr:mandelate racemase [Alphaproteobacteria bacterium]